MMRSADRLKKMHDSSIEELRNQEADAREQMFRLRFQWQMGQTETLNKMRQLRKDRARMLTVLKQKESSK
jgi:large subunit ribosomal protein L29